MQGGAVGGILPESGERAGRPPGGDAELQATAAQGVEHGGVLGRADRVLDGEGQDRGAEADAARALGRRGEEDERRGQPALVRAEVVLGHPGRGEAGPLGVLDLLQPEPVPVGGGSVLEQAAEEAQAGRRHVVSFRRAEPGTASSSPRVYSWRGAPKTSSTVPCSTWTPRRRTETVSEICRTTARSCEMKT